jgi:DNA-3-methyladenine glycosylase
VANSVAPRGLYADPPDLVARQLLGKLLVRQADKDGEKTELAGRIVEVEAYFRDDPAAHVFAGKTARNAVLYGPPGHAYVYFVYGMHYCLNVSCEPDGRPGCVLIRALEPMAGLEIMAERRGLASRRTSCRGPELTSGLTPGLTSGLTSGPGRLCQAFGITRERDNGADLTSTQSSLQIQEDGFDAGEVLVTPRIGIRKAAERMARFVLVGNAHVSGRKHSLSYSKKLSMSRVPPTKAATATNAPERTSGTSRSVSGSTMAK